MIITVHKLSEVYLHVTSTEAIEKELEEYFSFFAEGYVFNPKYKNSAWDGKIRLYSTNAKTLYLGLFRRLQEFAKVRNYTLKCDYDILLSENFSLVEAEEYFNAYCAGSKPNGGTLELRDVQRLAFAKSMRDKRRTFICPTASGKTIIAWLIASKVAQDLSSESASRKKILVVVPTVGLVQQTHSVFYAMFKLNDNISLKPMEPYDELSPGEFVSFPGAYVKLWGSNSKVPITGYRYNVSLSMLYGGIPSHFSKQLNNETGHHIIITTWQSIYDAPAEAFDDVECIIGDEAQGFKAKSLSELMKKIRNAPYRIGLTGSLDKTKVNRLTIEGLFGPIQRLATTKELQDKGELSKLVIKNLVLKYPKITREQVMGLNKCKGPLYQEEVQFIIDNPTRTRFVINLALSLSGNTLVLFNRVDQHGKVLYDKIKEKALSADVYFISGETPKQEREEIRQKLILDTPKNKILVASAGVFSTGMDWPNLNNTIAAHPYKGIIKTLQSIGRGLRISEGKTESVWYDIVDDLRVKGSRENYGIIHFKERLKIYDSQEFSYRNYFINL